MELLTEKGIWWGPQPFLDDEDAMPLPPGLVKGELAGSASGRI